MSDLAAALPIAIKVHADQRDKQGEPYLLHVLRVVEAVSDEAKVVAALHDVAEDGGGGYAGFPDDVFSRCGLAMWETFALEALTHDSADTYGEYIDKLICDRLGMDVAREVKLADLRDNLGRIPPSPDDPRHPTTMWTAEYTKADAERAWHREWSALKTRYETAIATLEAAT